MKLTYTIATLCVLCSQAAFATESVSERQPISMTSKLIAEGTNRAFTFTVNTSSPDEVWRLWTSPATWGDWDKGLKSASLDGPMQLGSKGTIVPLKGAATSFEVVEFKPPQSYVFETKLPMARLRVERSFNVDRTAFTHSVSFTGASAAVFARMFGPGFRKALPPTMQLLNQLAQGE